LDTTIIKYPAQIIKEGTYKITEVKGPQTTRQGVALILLVEGSDGKTLSCFVPYKSETSDRTNLYRLIQAFSKNTDKWPGHKIAVTKTADNKNHIEAA